MIGQGLWFQVGQRWDHEPTLPGSVHDACLPEARCESPPIPCAEQPWCQTLVAGLAKQHSVHAKRVAATFSKDSDRCCGLSAR